MYILCICHPFQKAELDHPELLNLANEIETCEKAAG